LIACLPAATLAFAPLTARLASVPVPRHDVAPRHRTALLSPSAQPRAATALSASQIQSPQLAVAPMSWLRVVGRLALMITAAFVVISLRVGRAFAVTAAKQAPSAASSLLTGDTLKYAGLCTVLGAMYAFRQEEKPILTETVMDEPEPRSPSALDLMDEDDLQPGAPPPLAEPPTNFDVDDSSIHSALLDRMRDLSTQRDADDAASDDESPPASDSPPDSTDSWGTGSTAVLEPPKPDGEGAPAPEGGLLDGVPNNPLGEGFPVVNNPEPDNLPAASEEQIAMLQRMFGSSGAQ
jgi:hypothetical protein